jgi:hypothetical protein
MSLFAQPSVTSRGTGSLIVSVLAHGAVAGMLYFGVTHFVRIDDRRLLERYSVRRLDLPGIDPAELEAPLSSITTNDFYPDAESRASLGVPPELNKAMRSFIDSATGQQALIQSKFYSQHLTFAEQFRLPSLVVWDNEFYPDTKSRSSRGVPPELTEAMRSFIESATGPQTLTQSEFRSHHLTFVEQFRLPNLAVRDNEFYPDAESRSSRGVPPELSKAMRSFIESAIGPQTLTQSEFYSQHLTFAEQFHRPNQVVWAPELSSMRMQDWAVRLAPVNEVAPAVTLRPAGRPLQTSAFAAPANNRSGLGGKAAPRTDTAQTDDETMDDSRLTTEHLVLPKSGRFGVVVVGNTVGEDYPESIEFWGNRVAYSAYLHVGLSKNWILQYSVLRSAEAADAGAVTRLEAPWPYDIFRPNLTSVDLSTGALMIHGILTSAGHFESLATAFPSRFRNAGFVLHALRQWQFRPARRNGQAIAVEVLLIIPVELE